MSAAVVFVRAVYRRTIYVGMFPSRIELRGALSVEGETLVMEYREHWRSPANLHRVEGQLKRVTVPCAAIAEPEVVSRWFGGRTLVLREAAFEALKGWPGARNGVCRLQLLAPPRQELGGAATELSLEIAEAQLRVLERRNDDDASDAGRLGTGDGPNGAG